MKFLPRFSSSPLFRHLLLAIFFTSSLPFLAACGNDVAATPTPLSSIKLNGNWTFTPNNSPNPGVSSMAATLANEQANGADISTPASGRLTISGSCMSDIAPAATVTGTITNPHDVTFQIKFSGAVDGGTLTIDGQEFHNTNMFSGAYTITGGPCQTTNASFTATRDGTNGYADPPTTYGDPQGI